ncbi:septum site-determining protein MinC [Metallumcola ferriviriculae]|uniref:Septum site-determining protein MinC n=1 Tax=Metallumcola ferriviriculae TaxID=3039180 RepID=A0AAU0UK07_9FIRM|nr:septum site-determining protein MinC [Desulfitibacteraceae bacterium MK1]
MVTDKKSGSPGEDNDNENEEQNKNAHPLTEETPTILIQKTLRSGQSIRYPGNVVVMGDVNPGAEITAGGNVVVMGSLRGVVHAGATGSIDALVTAFRLQPTQLRIADQITRAPDGGAQLPDQPEIAKIKNGRVVIERYLPGEKQKV